LPLRHCYGADYLFDIILMFIYFHAIATPPLMPPSPMMPADITPPLFDDIFLLMLTPDVTSFIEPRCFMSARCHAC